MIQQGFFYDQNNVMPVISPSDFNTDKTGTYVPAKPFHKLTFVCYKAAGTAGDDLVLSVSQATDSSGTGAKALTVSNVAYKVGASTVAFTKRKVSLSSLDLGALVTTDGTLDLGMDDTAGVFCIDVDPASLDTANSFNHVTITSEGDDLSNAGLAAVICVGQPRQGVNFTSA